MASENTMNREDATLSASQRDFDLLALGEVLLRLSPPINERLVRGDTFEKKAGGAELNVVSGVSLLGLHTGMISKLPANDLGTYIKNRIRFLGVSDDYLVYDSDRHARLGVYYYEGGAYPRKPRIVYDRTHTTFQEIHINDYDEKMFSSTRCFHTSGITLALSPNTRETAIEMIKRFKAQGTLISFDVNFRGISGAAMRQENASSRFFPMWISFSVRRTLPALPS